MTDPLIPGIIMMGGRWEDRHFSALGVMLMDGYVEIDFRMQNIRKYLLVGITLAPVSPPHRTLEPT